MQQTTSSISQSSLILSSKRQFWLKRAMSALGFFPLGIYVIVHLWTNLSVLGGAYAFEQALSQSRNHPAMIVLEWLLGIAFVFHMGVGFWLMRKWRPNNLQVRTFSNLKFLLQRISGIGLSFFLVAHVINARILPAYRVEGGFETFDGLQDALYAERFPITFIVYFLGLLGVAYHLANGLWSFLITWGVVVTPRAQRYAQIASYIVFFVICLMSGLILYGFYRDG